MTDTQNKLSQVRSVLARRELDAALIRRIPNFAWLTDGAANYVGIAAEMGSASLLVTPDAQFVLTSNIEATRLAAEEPLAARGFAIRPGPWYEPSPILAELARGLRLGAADLSDDFNQLRLKLTPAEGERFRLLGRACAQAMDAAIRQVRPGMTEHQIAGLLSDHTYAQGVVPIVNLIATDERIFRFRHPLPTGKRLDKYAMLVLCGRADGLVASITRLIHFGPLSDELRRKQIACATVDATFLSRTRPEARVADIFRAVVDAYAAVGFPGEWQHHHQGGAAGYQAREYVGTFSSTEVVFAGQAFAWNPSIAGFKCEDTILVGVSANEVLTETPGWPLLEVEVDGVTWGRPAILEVPR
jgi:Xaa-Pro aminopeptidase